MISLLLNYCSFYGAACYILEKVYVLLKTMCFLLSWDGIFCRFLLSLVFFRSSNSLLLFCLVVLSIVDNDMLNSPAVIVELPTFPFSSVHFSSFFSFFGSVVDAYLFIVFMSWKTLRPFHHYKTSFFVSCNNFCLKVYVV